MPRWLRRCPRARGHQILVEKGITAGLIGLGLLVMVGVATVLVSRDELSAGGHLAAVVLTTAAFLPPEPSRP
ncbi:MAG: hypothetical protein ACRDTX_10735 [Pseudonocardiaceae bacterium]